MSTTTSGSGGEKQQPQQQQADPAAASERRAKLLASSLVLFEASWAKADVLAAAAPRPAPATKKPNKPGSKKAAAAAATQPKSKKAAAAKDPKDEAIARLMLDLDEKINKAKRCKLEDLYTAVAMLECHQQQALSNILAVSAHKLLGGKQANEAALAIKDSLCAAVAAHSYRRPQAPEASKSTALTFRQHGLPACSALAAGFTAGQVLHGYSSAEVVQSQASLRQMRAAGISVSELYAHLPPDTAAQLTGVSGASQLRDAGYTAAAVQEGAAAAGAFSVWDLTLAGYKAAVPAAEQTPAGGAHVVGSSLSPRTGRLLLQPQPPKQPLSVADAVDYFRHAITPLMQMQAEQDVPPLLLLRAPHRHTTTAAQQLPAPGPSPSRLAARTASTNSSSRGVVAAAASQRQASRR